MSVRNFSHSRNNSTANRRMCDRPFGPSSSLLHSRSGMAAPPPDARLTLDRSAPSSGTCSAGTCSYAPIDTACNAPPAAVCIGSVARSYANPGTCNAGAGTCSYAPVDATCQFGCSGGVCVGDPCSGITCNSPPPSVCADASNVRIYSSTGTCSAGMCSYGSSTSYCANGCAGGVCQPCNASTCPAGCCTNNSCLDNDTNCRGSGGITCRLSGCTGGRYCDFGMCVCGVQPLGGGSSIGPGGEEICF